jgi:glycerol-3-phosphate dehydrogenase (NAD(P)+)
MKNTLNKVCVVGAGSWGTTLASLLANKGFNTFLWAREPEVAESILKERENKLFLPGVKLAGGLVASNNIKDCLEGAQLVVCAVPSHGIRGVFGPDGRLIRKDAVVVSVSKGIEEDSLLTPSAILSGVLCEASFSGHVAVLSGPSFASEVSLGLPTAVSAACADIASAMVVQNAFSTPAFRVYTNTDIIGVETGGALKNVIAIASGISDGLCLGHNARAALITRGLAEITRLGVKLGANAATFYGLSGLGDLVLTCTGPLSRNYSLGVRVGKGEGLESILANMNTVAEGVKTSRAGAVLSRRLNVEMPITSAVCDVLYNGKRPKDAVIGLMARDLKGE